MNALRRIGNALARIPGGRTGKWIVLGLWLVLLVGIGPLAGKLSGAESNQASSWLPGSAESTKVLSVSEQFQSQNQATAVVVYERGSGITAADYAKAKADTAKFKTVDTVLPNIVGPVPSKDGKALETFVTVDLPDGGWTQLTPAVKAMRAQADAGDPGLAAHITGPAGYGADEEAAFTGIDGVLLYSTIAVVIVLLLFTYRSPLLWILPLASSGLALAVAEGIVYLLAKHAGLTVNAQSAGILLVLVMGAGTDYALLIVARYREELRRHEDRHEAMGIALHRAGPPVLASAATVGVSMLCLTFAELNSTSGLGPVCAVGVLVALLAMTTLLPALLTIFGRWFFWPVRPKAGTDDPTSTGLWARIGGTVSRGPRRVWIGTAVVLAALAFAATGLKASGVSTAGTFTNAPDSVTGATVLGEHFPAGQGEPVVVVGNAAQATQIRQVFAAQPQIAAVSAPQEKNGYVYLTGTLVPAPDSASADGVISDLRSSVHAIPGAGAMVGGATAVAIDTENANRHDRDLLIPLILAVVLVILGLLLRAVVAPLVLIATVVLSFGAAMGISALLFNHVFHFSGADASFPLLTFVFLVALGIDYNIFLSTRIREEAAVHGTRAGARIALAATGGVITSAGMILAGTFSVLGTLPVVTFAEIGVAVALGVLLDTFVVRSVLVTALAMDLGNRLWWPGRPERRLGATPQPAADAQAQATDLPVR
ncbi:MAG TPA: MMPL family transporter [Actinocrinis sp.]